MRTCVCVFNLMKGRVERGREKNENRMKEKKKED